jgi:aminomethyltransferase
MKSPLYQWHLAAEAKLADFGGWEMPIEYPKGAISGFPGGVLAEHAAVRERVGLFDVSHLGKISVCGQGAKEFLNQMITNDLNRISSGTAQYNLLCNESGGVVDDLIVYQKTDTDFFLIPNAANCSAVAEVLKSHAPDTIAIANLHNQFGVLALQGPLAGKVLESLGLSLNLEYMQFTEVLIPGHEDLSEIIICRTGYTGEFGYELLPKWESTLAVWELLIREVSVLDGRACGLGARDTLRTEMGYPLHGHELSLEISPLQANAGWAVGFSKLDFLGRTCLLKEKEVGVTRILRGLKCMDRGIPRPGMSVLDGAGQRIGEVTSGTFSPSIKSGIALALLSPAIKIGDPVTIDVRGRPSQAQVIKPPFVPSHVR